MRKLDLLFSHSPNTYIFQREANKTNFGGFCCFIYIIFLIVIMSIYLYQYIFTEKYTVEYSLFFNTSTIKDKINMLSDNDLNPTLNFSFDLFKFDIDQVKNEIILTNLSNNYILVNVYESNNYQKIIPINRNTIIRKRVYPLGIGIFYECKNSSYIIEEEDNLSPMNYINLTYEGFELEHQNWDKPLKAKDTVYTIPFYNNKITSSAINWEIIKYIQKKKGIDMFRCLKNFTSGFIESSTIFNPDVEKINFEYNGHYYKLLGTIEFKNTHDKYIQYTRTRINEFDMIGMVFSYWSLTLNILRIFFNYYSNNFDNYKIIEAILSKNNINNKDNNGGNNKKSLSDFKNLNDSLLENKKSDNKKYKLELAEINKSSPLVDDFPDEKNLIINDDGFNVGEATDENKIKSELPKLTFKDFYINNIYSCFNSHNNSQQIIKTCNEILLKYYSIDYIVYNLIKLENLFKDYKWNDPSLSNIDNNELLIKLKTLL